MQKAKQDAIADAQKLIAEREQAAKDEAQSQIQALQAKLTEIQQASEQAISSFESEKKEAAQVFEGLLKEKDDQLAGFKSDFDKACAEESAKRAEEAAAEAAAAIVAARKRLDAEAARRNAERLLSASAVSELIGGG